MARVNREQSREVPKGTSLVVFEQTLAKTEPDFKRLSLAARRGIDYGREAQFAMSIFAESEQLQKCHADSFKEAFTNLGAMGLSLNKNLGQAALIPRWNAKRKCNWAVAMPMYRGLISLATGGSVIKNVYGMSVVDGDYIDVTLGTIVQISHKPKMRKRGEGGNPGPDNMIGCYCIADIAGSDLPHATWMSIDEVLSVAERSESYSPKPRPEWQNGKPTGKMITRDPSGPWITDFGQMAVKSAFRRAFKTWPGVDKVEYTALQEAVRVDTESEIIEQSVREAEPDAKPDATVEATTCMTAEEVFELNGMCVDKKLRPSRIAEAYGCKDLKDLPSELYLEVKARITKAKARE